MDGSPLTLLKFLLPKTPFLLKTAASHTLGWSHTSSKWDLKTELTINVLREMLCNGPRSTVSQQQKGTLRDPGVKGRMWISRVRVPAPQEDDVRQLLFKVIEELNVTGQETYIQPQPQPVEAEWTGYRSHVSKDAPEPSISEEAKYKNLMEEVTSEATVLYFHGGAMYLLDPASHRPWTSKIAHLSGGRCYSVRYRLAPQNPFPAAILDAINAYLSLLYPPEGVAHDAVPASKIVFAGDSAGGLLSVALLEFLLQCHRTGKTKVHYNGREVDLPLPAGLALSSPWLDVTRSMPSLENNAHYDYLPPPSMTRKATYPPCPIWPTNPPRADLYCDGPSLCHPLVSPLAQKDWRGAPPIHISVGEEELTDENAIFAQRLAKQSVEVNWEQYEAMPHCWGLIMADMETSRVQVQSFADHIKRFVERPGDVKLEGTFVVAKSLSRKTVDLERLTTISDEEADRRMDESRELLCKRVDKEGKANPML